MVSASRVASVGRAGGVCGVKSPPVDTTSAPCGGSICHVVARVVTAISGARWRIVRGRNRPHKPLVSEGGLCVSYSKCQLAVCLPTRLAGRQGDHQNAVAPPHFDRIAVQQHGPQIRGLRQRQRDVLQRMAAQPESSLVASPALTPGDADNLHLVADRVQPGHRRVMGRRNRQPVRQTLIVPGRDDPLLGSVGDRHRQFGRIQMAEVVRFIIDLLVARRLDGHDAALPRNVSARPAPARPRSMRFAPPVRAAQTVAPDRRSASGRP
jgi:hypothetical protein